MRQRTRVMTQALASLASRGWIHLPNVSVHPWTISGLESTVTVRLNNELSVAFDMGTPTRESVKCNNVFISHGHIDHIGAIPQHAARRELFSCPPATYHMPPHLAPSVRDIAASYQSMHEMGHGLANLNIKEMVVGDEVMLPSIQGHYKVTPFETFHRVQSQGYLIYSESRQLKPEYKGRHPMEIGKLFRDGCEVHEVASMPEVAYTGDTLFDVLRKPSHADLLHVRTLIMEATYIDDKCDVSRAHAYGHTHLYEIIENARLFDDVESIVLVHFSDRYSASDITNTLQRLLPPELLHKVHVSSVAKELY